MNSIDQSRRRAPISNFSEKVVFISGGTSGIGLGIARTLHSAGAHVVLGHVDVDQVTAALKMFPNNGASVRAIKHDVSNAEQWQSLASDIEREFGGLDILVNNAGVAPMARAISGSVNDWTWALSVNLWGPIFGIQTFVPRMLKRGTGAHILTTASTSGILPGSGAGVYTVSKMAAVGLMEELRHELANSCIGTSVLIPGMTATDIGSSERYRPADLRDLDAPSVVNKSIASASRTPSGNYPPAWRRPQDPMTVGRFVLDGILHNDLYIIMQPEFRHGVELRANALLESMIPFTTMPAQFRDRDYSRTKIFLNEINHRRQTRHRPLHSDDQGGDSQL